MGLESEVMRFVAEQWHEPISRITCATTLYADLHIAGDDAEEFFGEFAKRFSVDLSGLRLSKHFPAEDEVGFIDAWESLCRLVRRPRHYYVPITVGDLIRVAERKSWTDAAPPH